MRVLISGAVFVIALIAANAAGALTILAIGHGLKAIGWDDSLAAAMSMVACGLVVTMALLWLPIRFLRIRR